MMNLRALVEKMPDADLLCLMIGFAAERLPSQSADCVHSMDRMIGLMTIMELEVGAATGAGYGEMSPLRLA